MEKIITISGNEIKFKSSGALPRIYRTTFNEDLFADISKLEGTTGENALDNDVISTLENVAFCMAKHADASIGDDIISWLEQFETFALVQALPEILDLWTKEIESKSTP